MLFSVKKIYITPIELKKKKSTPIHFTLLNFKAPFF